MRDRANDPKGKPVVDPVVCTCGGTLFYESVRCGGWWKSLIDGDGTIEDTDLDNIKYGPAPKTVTCADCGKRNPNPKYWNPT